MEIFIKQLKKQLLQEFRNQDRKGIYAYTQKNMAYNSNKIEGSTLTSEQTASLFDTGTMMMSGDLVYRTKDVEEMTGHFKMFNEVLKNLDKPLTSDMIKSFHYQLKSGVFEDYANGYPIGEFKNRANQVSDIVTEKPQNIPDRIENLIQWYNSSEKKLADIARFHAEYEHIHPFQDGNGRTGRAVILKQCLDSDIIPVIISNDDKTAYYHALHTAQVEGDYEKLLTFFKKSQDKYYQHVKKFIIMPTEKTEKASKIMNGFAALLKTKNFVNESQIVVCDLPDAVRCFVRNNSSMIMIDFLQYEITIALNSNIVTPDELKERDEKIREIYKKTISTLKEYMDECSNAGFEKYFG